MTMVDWLLTEQLVKSFRDAMAKRPDLNVTLEAHSPHGEDDVLGGAGTAVRIDATDGSVYLLTPRRLLRIVGETANEVVAYSDLVGYDWISPEMSEKVALKDEHFDRLYLYRRASPPIVLQHLGPAVYPLLTFLGRALEYQSQKVLLRKLDDDIVARLGQCLTAAAYGPFFSDDELEAVFSYDRGSLQVVATLWPRVNLAAPDLRKLIERVVETLIARARSDDERLSEWVDASSEQLEAAVEVFRRVASGEV